MGSHFRAARPVAAALAAFVLLTANAVVTAAVVTAAVVTAGGIAAMLVLDYGRSVAPYTSGADVVPFEARAQGPADTREAA
jgi:hypothetical protein